MWLKYQIIKVMAKLGVSQADFKFSLNDARFRRTDFADFRSRNAGRKRRVFCQRLHLSVAERTFGFVSQSIVLSLLQRANSGAG
jgi:hypothetical protein